MTKRDLIDLAIEYSMIRSTIHFNGLNTKQQDAILRQIRNVVTPDLEEACRAAHARVGA